MTILVNPDPLPGSDLLREATKKQKAGDINAAIELLKEAYNQIALTPVAYSVETFLRLPLYLQKAGRNDEAWREFNILLTRGFPNQSHHTFILPMIHCEIYDKMRLFLQREKKFDLAIRFGVWSYISWAIGLSKQNRSDELESYIERENIEENLSSLLMKAERLNLMNEVADVIEDETRKLPNVDIRKLGNKIDKIVFR